MAGYESILLFGDVHLPFHHVDTFDFLKALVKEYKPDKVISTSDNIDNHCLSFHESNCDLPFSASSELERAVECMHMLYDFIPECECVESNHTSLFYRRSKSAGIPRHLLRNYNEILEAPKGWKWNFDTNVTMSNGQNLYIHHSLKKSAVSASRMIGGNYAQGHWHGQQSVTWTVTPKGRYFAVDVGCLADPKSLAMEYGKNNMLHHALGATVILYGVPFNIPMLLNKKGRWIGEL